MERNLKEEPLPLETNIEYLARTLPKLKENPYETLTEMRIRLTQERDEKDGYK